MTIVNVIIMTKSEVYRKELRNKIKSCRDYSSTDLNIRTHKGSLATRFSNHHALVYCLELSPKEFLAKKKNAIKAKEIFEKDVSTGKFFVVVKSKKDKLDKEEQTRFDELAREFPNQVFLYKSSADISRLKQSLQALNVIESRPPETDNSDKELLNFIANFSNKFSATNSTGIKNMKIEMSRIAQGKGSVDDKWGNIVSMMNQISVDRLSGLCGMRSLLSNVSFFGNGGRSKHASSVYTLCVKEQLTKQDLLELMQTQTLSDLISREIITRFQITH